MRKLLQYQNLVYLTRIVWLALYTLLLDGLTHSVTDGVAEVVVPHFI